MNELVLIVDDEPGIRTTLGGILDDEGYRTVATSSGEEALALFESQRPDVVFLDIWLADRDGLETLRALRASDPKLPVIMMSGHGSAATAAQTIKMGAVDYLEKPLSYQQVMEAVGSALEGARGATGSGDLLSAESESDPLRAGWPQEAERPFKAPPLLPQVRVSETPQRTIAESSVIYGLGLHSGGRTGMAIQPLPPNSGIHFVTLPKGNRIPAHVGSVSETEYATVVTGGGESIRTVEHLLSALHAFGVTNLLIKVHGEIPVLDGSAVDFCHRLSEIGVIDQGEPRKELVIDRRFEIAAEGGKSLVIEPFDGFSVSYLLRYPAPVGEQFFEFQFGTPEDYAREIAPARTFGFMRDLKKLAELGLGSGGRLDNFILVGEDNVINTELRFADEFVRHKILDVIGDLYLLGYPMRGKVTARLTGHRDNIAIQRQIFETA